MVGWMLVWSDQTELPVPRCATPGPTMPSQVVLIWEPTSPWFHASVGSSPKQDLPHVALPLDRKKSVLAKSITVGVRLGSPVIMCRIFSSTGSARYLVSQTVCPVTRSLPVSLAAARSSERTGELDRPGWPCT